MRLPRHAHGPLEINNEALRELYDLCDYYETQTTGVVHDAIVGAATRFAYVGEQVFGADWRGTVSAARYPEVEVELTNEDGNATAILARVTRELRRAGAPPQEISRFHAEAMAGNFNELVQTVMRWVEVRR